MFIYYGYHSLLRFECSDLSIMDGISCRFEYTVLPLICRELGVNAISVGTNNWDFYIKEKKFERKPIKRIRIVWECYHTSRDEKE